MEPLKPGEGCVLFKDTFDTLEALKVAIAKAEHISNQEAYLINVDGTFELEAECLSDGSIVYNIGLEGNMQTDW